MRPLQLYASPFGGSAIVEAALTLCGLEYETLYEDFEQLGDFEALEALEALNPLCQIPVLVLPDGTVMTASGAKACGDIRSRSAAIKALFSSPVSRYWISMSGS